jgi:hypothetical protein
MSSRIKQTRGLASAVGGRASGFMAKGRAARAVKLRAARSTAPAPMEMEFTPAPAPRKRAAGKRRGAGKGKRKATTSARTRPRKTGARKSAGTRKGCSCSKVGSKLQVWNGTKTRTSGGLSRADLMKNKRGKVVSKKQHAAGLRAKRYLGL